MVDVMRISKFKTTRACYFNFIVLSKKSALEEIYGIKSKIIRLHGHEVLNANLD